MGEGAIAGRDVKRGVIRGVLLDRSLIAYVIGGVAAALRCDRNELRSLIAGRDVKRGMKKLEIIILSFAISTVSSCNFTNSRAYTKETANLLRTSLIENKRKISELHHNGKVTEVCMEIIFKQIDMALTSLELDEKGDPSGRDRALRLSEEASVERKELGCP